MIKKNFKFVVVLLLLGVTGYLSWSQYFKIYKQEDSVSIHNFPQKVGDWTAEELPISDDEYDILETRNAFARRYTNSSGQEAYLFIVYSQNNRKVSHPPEVCYVGSGVTVTSNTPAKFDVPSENMVVQTNKLRLSHRDASQVAYYWFKVGDSFTPSYWKQQGLIAFKTLIGKPASSALIRISTTVHDSDENEAEGTAKAFGQDVIPLLKTYLP